MKRRCLSAMAALLAIPTALVSNTFASDLGGNCCSDLEERIAELESTTARKGNRKVSLTISGWVAEQITLWDDGVERNVYVTGVGSALATHVTFSGSASISPDLTAGYVLHLEAIDSDPTTTNQSRPDGPSLITNGLNAVQTFQSYWFLKSDRLGKVSVGLQSQPSDNAAILVDGSGSLVPANWAAYDVFSFNIRDRSGGNVSKAGSPLVWGNVGACLPGDCYGLPFDGVRYDTPTWNGFSFSTSWSNHDIWDVAARYAGELEGFKVALTATYGQEKGAVIGGVPNSEYLQVGAYGQHIATGLFALINYASINDDVRDAAGLNPDVWYFKGGLRRNWNALGATVPYGEYLISRESVSSSSKLQWWGGGVVQEIDAAAMSLYLKYRNFSFSDDTLCTNGCRDMTEFTVGGLISF